MRNQDKDLLVASTPVRIENCQIGVFLAAASKHGRTLLDRGLNLPQQWAENMERREAAGIRKGVKVSTGPRPARQMVERALQAAVPVGDG